MTIKLETATRTFLIIDVRPEAYSDISMKVKNIGHFSKLTCDIGLFFDGA